MNNRYWYYLFFASLLAEITAISLQWNNMQFFTKPLLVIILFTWFITSTAKLSPLRYYIAAALFFSWLGDIFLLMEAKGPYWFMAGLGSFLLAHVMYILFFLRLRSKLSPQRPWNLFIIAIVAVYAISLVTFLYPYIGSLKIPVGVYALAISAMLITAAHGFNKNTSGAAMYCIAGAGLFVVSDSLLSINKFYHSFPAAGTAIMLTYGLAQFAITKGSLQYLAGKSG